MNRSNGSSRAAAGKATADAATSKTKKSDSDGVVVSFDSDNESSGDDNGSEEEEDEGRSSSASSVQAESEADPSSEDEESSAEETELQADGGDESKTTEKHDNGVNASEDEDETVRYKVTLQPTAGDDDKKDEKEEDKDEEDEGGADGEEQSEKNDDDDEEDVDEEIAEVSSEEDQDQSEDPAAKDVDVATEEAEEEQVKSDVATEKVKSNDDDDNAAILPTADYGSEDVTAEVPEPSVDNMVTTKNTVDESTPENVTVASSAVDVEMPKPVIEQPRSSTPAADKETDVVADQVTVGGGGGGEGETAIVQPPVPVESATEEKKKKKKSKKKRNDEDTDIVNEAAKEDEVKSDVATEKAKSKDDKKESVNVGVSGDQIDKPDLLSNSIDTGNEQVIVKAEPDYKVVEGSETVQLNEADNQEATSSPVVERSLLVDGVEITPSVPLAPKEKKKKKHATSPAISHVDVGESVNEGVEQVTLTTDGVADDASKNLPRETEPTSAITVDIAGTEKEKQKPPVKDQLPVDEPAVATTPEVEEEKEGKKKKKKKKISDRTAEDKQTPTSETGNVNGDVANEEPTPGVRRNSIDEFIRRILAEAREEQKKRTEDIRASTTTEHSTVTPALEQQQQQPSITKSRVQPDVVPSVNGNGGKTDDDTGIKYVAAVTRDVPATENVDDLSSASSMLDRRLASTDRKREHETSASVVADDLITDPAYFTKAFPIPTTSAKNLSAVADYEAKPHSARNGIGGKAQKGAEDIDQELAEISQIFAKRTPLNIENGIDDDEEDAVSGWLKSRQRVNGKMNGSTADEIIDVNDSPNGIDSVLSGARRFSAQFGLPDVEEFIPARRPETDEIIRNRLRPVRAVIDQQTDVIQRLKSIGRDVTVLDDEIRNIRQSCVVDRKTAVDSMLAAVAEEMRLYEAEQRAAEERVLRQLVVIRFVREQFVASVMSPAVGGTRTRGDIFDRITAAAISGLAELSFVKSPSSQTGYRGASGLELPTSAVSRRAQSVAPGGAGDFLDAGRRTRGGSVTRDISSQRGDGADGAGDEPSAARKRLSAAQYSQNFGNDTADLTDGGDRRSRLLRGGSVGPSWHSSSSSFETSSQKTYESGDSTESGRRRPTSNFPSFDAYSSSGEDATPSRRFSSYRGSTDYSSDQPSDYRRGANGSSSGYASSSSSILDDSSSESSSRYARRYSVADATNSRYSDRYSSRGSSGESSTYSSGSYTSRVGGGSTGSGGGGGSEFQSRFLDKVRERKAKAANGGEYSSTSSVSTESTSSTADKPFKSRFLKSSFDSDPPPRRYTSTASSYD